MANQGRHERPSRSGNGSAPARNRRSCLAAVFHGIVDRALRKISHGNAALAAAGS